MPRRVLQRDPFAEMLLHIVDGIVEHIFALNICMLKHQSGIARDQARQPADQIVSGVKAVTFQHEFLIQGKHLLLIRPTGNCGSGKNSHQLQRTNAHRLVLAAGCKENVSEDVIQETARVSVVALRDRFDQLLLLFDRISGGGILQLVLLEILANGLILLRLIPLLDHRHTAVPDIECRSQQLQ